MFRDSFPRRCEVIWKRLAVLMVLPLIAGFLALGQGQTPQSSDASGPPPGAPKVIPGSDNPNVSAAPVDLGTYIIGPNDVLFITVFREKELTTYYPVRTDGMITIPLFGDMKADGLTPLQLKKQLTEALSEKYKDPDVTVSVWDVRSKNYTVAGAVKRPGQYPLIKKTTVFDAINNASGFADAFANEKDILIIRGDKRMHFNYKRYLDGKDVDKNIVLENGDVVSVK